MTLHANAANAPVEVTRYGTGPNQAPRPIKPVSSPLFASVRAAAQYLLDPPADLTADRIDGALELISAHLGLTYARASTGVWVAVREHHAEPTGPYGSRLEAQFMAVSGDLQALSAGGQP